MTIEIDRLDTHQAGERRLWARVGVSIYVSDETYEKLAQGDNNALKAVLLGQDGRAELDGETYFPESMDNENENNSIKYDFDFAPTPLYEASERNHRMTLNTDPIVPNSFYYTFGTVGTQPFQKGWVEVQAQDRQQADQLFRKAYPDHTPGVLNCSSVYDQAHFSKYLETISEHPDWNVCHNTIRNSAEISDEKVYVLCEEHEDDNGIVDFNILGVSKDRDELQKLLSAKVKKDEYGLIASNGLLYEDPHYVQTDYVDEQGFVKYYLQEEDVLNKEQIKEMLHSEEYDTAFHHPDNLTEILKDAVTDLAMGRGYGTLDYSKAIGTIMNDPKFHAFVKQSWWGSLDTIAYTTARSAKSHIRQYIADLLDEDPSFFVRIGAVSKDIFPENMKDILISSIYDVFRDNRLPVSNVDALAEQLMDLDSFTNDIIEPYRGFAHLKEQSAAYDDTLQACYEFVKSNLVPSKDQKLRIDDLLMEANRKKDEQRIPEQRTDISFSKD